MGGIYYRVGDYRVVETDYAYEVPEGGAESAEYYDSLIASIAVEKLRSFAKGRELEVPVSELWRIVQGEDGRHFPSWSLGKEDEGKTPRDWLFNKLTDAGETIVITPALHLLIGDSRMDQKIPKYYLNSDLYDEDIVIKATPREYLITDLKMLEWLYSKGFDYSW
jgi:hypothetical protein